jgi:hypothetical protein
MFILLAIYMDYAYNAKSIISIDHESVSRTNEPDIDLGSSVSTIE